MKICGERPLLSIKSYLDCRAALVWFTYIDVISECKMQWIYLLFYNHGETNYLEQIKFRSQCWWQRNKTQLSILCREYWIMTCICSALNAYRARSNRYQFWWKCLSIALSRLTYIEYLRPHVTFSSYNNVHENFINDFVSEFLKFSKIGSKNKFHPWSNPPVSPWLGVNNLE